MEGANTQGQPQNQQLDPVKERAEALKRAHKNVGDLLEKYRGAFLAALPKFLTPDRLIRVALTAISKTPALLECTQHSLIGCILTSAQLGLLPDGVLGEAYLIPFNNNKRQSKECQLIIGYRGLCALAMRSGMVASIQARAVYAGDKFEYAFGLVEKLDHVPCGEMNDEKITHFYCIVKFKNGGHVFDVMTRDQVIAVRNESKNYAFAKDKSETVWHKYFKDMGAKTVLRRLMKFVPLSPEIQKAIGMDELGEAGMNQGVDAEFFSAPEIPDDDKTFAAYEIVKDQEDQQKDSDQQNADALKDKADKAAASVEGMLADKKKG